MYIQGLGRIRLAPRRGYTHRWREDEGEKHEGDTGPGSFVTAALYPRRGTVLRPPQMAWLVAAQKGWQGLKDMESLAAILASPIWSGSPRGERT